MERGKLTALIEEQNEQREREALREAEGLINDVAKEQQKIRQSQERIVKLRGELKALEVEQLDQSAVLGDE